MKIAVKKEPGIIPFSGFHYMLHPFEMKNDFEADAFNLMGHIIIEIDKERGETLLFQARDALKHQCEIAILADEAEKQNEGKI